ncbi:Light-harvesting complex-like protein OHP2, chloroplastic, partial [Mucuna pruriens]
MLLTVEGGGFFSSSASGYSKGLALLILGQRSDDKPMRVLPWNQFQLVGQESDHELQLASRKKHLSSRCASFVCFGRASAGLDNPSHLKVGPAKHHEVSSGTLVSNKGNYPSANVNDDSRKVALKSSLKRQASKKPAPVEAATEHEASGGKGNDAPGQRERRKVQWTDACGSELVEIQEFEPRCYNWDLTCLATRELCHAISPSACMMASRRNKKNKREKMSMACSIPCIKISTCSSSPSCTSSTSSYSLRFSSSSSSSKTHSVIIRSSQAEGPVRRPVAPPIREPSSSSAPQLQKPTLPSQPPPSPSVVPPPQKPATVVGDDKNAITLEFQRQKAKELQEYFKQKKLEEANQAPFFGFIGKNEISNGRWAMFGFAVGLLTEYATGSDFVDQVKILLSNFGIIIVVPIKAP